MMLLTSHSKYPTLDSDLTLHYKYKRINLVNVTRFVHGGGAVLDLVMSLKYNDFQKPPKAASDEEEEDGGGLSAAKASSRERPGRAKKEIKYFVESDDNNDEGDDDDDDMFD